MKKFYKVVQTVKAITGAAQYINGQLVSIVDVVKQVVTCDSDCEVVGSGCEDGLPSLSPHSQASTYSYLTLHSDVHTLNKCYLAATKATSLNTKGSK